MTSSEPLGQLVQSTLVAPLDEKEYLHRWLRMVRDAAPGESTAYIVDLYRRACAHADQTIAELELDTIGTVTHNREKLTLRQALVHMIHETSRHAGHADIVRELIDGTVGGARDNPYVPDWAEEAWWRDYLARVKASAAAAEQAAE